MPDVPLFGGGFVLQEKQARIDGERARLEAVRVAPDHPLAVAAEAVSGQKVRSQTLSVPLYTAVAPCNEWAMG